MSPRLEYYIQSGPALTTSKSPPASSSFVLDISDLKRLKIDPEPGLGCSIGGPDGCSGCWGCSGVPLVCDGSDIYCEAPFDPASSPKSRLPSWASKFSLSYRLFSQADSGPSLGTDKASIGSNGGPSLCLLLCCGEACDCLFDGGGVGGGGRLGN